jgi:hypothetical protein
LTAIGMKLYLFGGVEFDSFYNDLWMLDVSAVSEADSGMLQWVQCTHLTDPFELVELANEHSDDDFEDDDDGTMEDEGNDGTMEDEGNNVSYNTGGGEGYSLAGNTSGTADGGVGSSLSQAINPDEDDSDDGDDADDADDADDDADVEDAIDYQDAPDARWGHTATAIGGVLVLFGGSCPGEAFNDVWSMDLAEPDGQDDEPLDLPDPQGGPLSRQSSEASSFGAGAGDSSPRSGDVGTHDAWVLSQPKHKSVRWHRQRVSGEPPAPRGGHSAAVVGQAVFIFGGNTTPPSVRTFNDLWRLQFIPDDEINLIASPLVRSSSAPLVPLAEGGTVKGGEIGGEMLGGQLHMPSMFRARSDGGGSALREGGRRGNQHLLPNQVRGSFRWEQIRTDGIPPAPCIGHSGFSMGRRLYIFGGRNFKTRVFASKVHVYNSETNGWSELPVSVGGGADGAAGDGAAGGDAAGGDAGEHGDDDDGMLTDTMDHSSIGRGAGAGTAGISAGVKNVMRFHSYTDRVPTRTGHAAAPHRNGMVFFGGMSERADNTQHFLDDMILLDMF